MAPHRKNYPHQVFRYTCRALATLDSDIAKSVTPVVLFGDPARHPSDAWTHGTTDRTPGSPPALQRLFQRKLLLAPGDTPWTGMRSPPTARVSEDCVTRAPTPCMRNNEDRVQDRAAWFITGKLGGGSTLTSWGLVQGIT